MVKPIVLLLALFTVGAVALSRQRTEHQTALAADPTDFIYEEETGRDRTQHLRNQ